MSNIDSIILPGWETKISDVGFHKINIRGYPLDDMIRKLSFSEIVYLTIRGELPTPEQKRVMDAALCSIVDHGLFTPTSLAARVITSASPDTIIPAIAGGMLTIGSVTASPQDTGRLILYAHQKMTKQNLKKEEVARQIVEEYGMKKKRLPGIGHPLHPSGDPRAIALKEIAVENGMWSEKSETYEEIVKLFSDMVRKQLPINIDGMLGCVLTELGFSPKEMAGIAAISFMPGIIAHAVEESANLTLRAVECKYTGCPERRLA